MRAVLCLALLAAVTVIGTHGEACDGDTDECTHVLCLGNNYKIICLNQICTCEGQAAMQVLDSDMLCRQAYGNDSYLCRENYNNGGYDYVCSSMYCYNPAIRSCDDPAPRNCVFGQLPRDQMPCGNSKWCISHTCTADNNATATSDDCPLGDSTKPNVILDLSCEDIAQDHPYMCYNHAVSHMWCCDVCANMTIADPVLFPGPPVQVNNYCQTLFGNQSYFCMNDAHYSGSYSDICLTTYCYDAVYDACKPIPAADGVPCGNGQWCVGGKCVTSLLAPPDPDAACLYGSAFQAFCVANIKYPNISHYCSQSGYETGCCDECSFHKNTSRPAGCEYGDLKPVACQQHVTAGTIRAYCVSDGADCCETCTNLQDHTNANCPFGDADVAHCQALMADNIGPGNCYSPTNQQQCCDTCPKFYNASQTGCEYDDHWKQYCIDHIQPPNVATACSTYETECCGSCGRYKQGGFPGCEYGDRDPAGCAALMNTTQGSSNCYNIVHQTQCCSTCGNIRDSSTPSCLYGDKNPGQCENLMSDDTGPAHCYNIGVFIDCCRTCPRYRNDSNTGCEYGDRQPPYCNTTIVDSASAHYCYNYESICCESCADYKVSHIADCKYGDKHPVQCQYQIPDKETAARRCPQLRNSCCATCSKHGHPGPGGGIPVELLDLVG